MKSFVFAVIVLRISSLAPQPSGRQHYRNYTTINLNINQHNGLVYDLMLHLRYHLSD